MSYFVITGGEDGMKVRLMPDADALKKWIGQANGPEIRPECRMRFLDLPPSDGYYRDLAEHAAIVIKGEIVVPKPVKVVTEYEVA